MHVVEDDDERVVSGERLEQHAHGPERFAARHRRRPIVQSRHVACCKPAVVVAGKHACNGVLRHVAGDSADEVQHRQEGRALAVRRAVAHEHPAAHEGRGELLYEARLADPGVPEHRDGDAAAVLGRAGERVSQGLELVGPAHERRVESTVAALRPPHCLERSRREIPGADRDRRLGGHRVAHERVRRLGDEDPTAGRAVAQGGGDGDHVADDRRVGRAREHLARRQSDMDDVALGSEGFAQLDRRPGGSQRIVLVRTRDAEHRERLRPEEAVEHAAVPVGGVAHRFEKSIDASAQGFGVDLGHVVQRRGEHGDGLARRHGTRDGCRRRHLRLDREQGRVLPQHAPLELLQRGGRIDAEAVDERPPRVRVRLERLRLPVGTVESEHLLRTEPLA